MGWFAELFDCRCVGCGAWGAQLCDDCLLDIVGHRVEARIAGRTVLAVGRYEGTLRRLIRVAKHGGQRAIVARFADRLTSLAGSMPATVVVPIPSSHGGFRARGYGLSDEVANATSLSVAHVLRMVDQTSQRNRDRDERSRVRSLRVDSTRLTLGTHVILADDVVTTGSTLCSAIRACERAGLVVDGAVVLAVAGNRDNNRKVLGKSIVEV